MRGIITGAFALIVLQVLVANPRATSALGGVATGLGTAVHWFLDPNTPAIPDHSTTTAAAVTPSTPATSPIGSPPGNTGLILA